LKISTEERNDNKIFYWLLHNKWWKWWWKRNMNIENNRNFWATEPLLAPDLETIIRKYKILFIYYIILKINKVDSI
jgi:hypothetical protein